MSLPLLKPLLLTVGATSLVFFGGVIALSVQSPSADDALSAANVMSQNTDITAVSSDLSSFKAVANPLTQPPSANPSPLAALTATQATALAQQDAPTNSVLQGSPELVNYNGTVAYEVLLDSGATYIDASVGTVLNPVATNDYRAERFDDDDDDDYEDKHHDDDKHKEDKHRKAHDKKYYKENDRLIAMSYQQHDEEEYDD